MKKSQIMALLSITICNDEFDDNGYEAMKPEYDKFSKGVNDQYSYDPSKESFQTITKKQIKDLQIELAFVPGLEKRTIKSLNLRSIADIPTSKFPYVWKNVLDNKDTYLKQQKIRVR